jgi:zinc protease
MPQSGFTGLSADALKAVLAGKNASMSADIGQTYSRLSGSADRAGLETLFQLIHRTMTDPLVDSGYFKLLTDKLRDRAATFANSPENLFYQQVGSALFGDNPKTTLFTKEEDISLLDPARIKAQFVAFFGAPKGFTFAYSGSFDAAAMRDFSDRYLGSLPAGDGPSGSIQPFELVSGSIDRTVKAGSENKAEVVLVYKTPQSATDLTTIHGLDVLSEALKRRLRDELRIAAGGSYDPSVGALTDEEGHYSTIEVDFGTSPERDDELIRLAAAQVERLRNEALSQADIDEIVLASKRELEVSRNTDNYWAHELAYAVAHGRGLDVPGDELAALAAVTPDWLQAAARRYLDPSQLAKFVLLPKTSP